MAVMSNVYVLCDNLQVTEVRSCIGCAQKLINEVCNYISASHQGKEITCYKDCGCYRFLLRTVEFWGLWLQVFLNTRRKFCNKEPQNVYLWGNVIQIKIGICTEKQQIGTKFWTEDFRERGTWEMKV